MNTLIQQKLKLIKSDSQVIFIVTDDSYFK